MLAKLGGTSDILSFSELSFTGLFLGDVCCDVMVF